MNPISFPDSSRLMEELLLGVDHRPISTEIANIIYSHFQNKTSYFVEYERWDDPRSENPTSILLERPNLWRFDNYLQSSEKWKSARNWSEQERIKRWIAEANVKIVSAGLVRLWQFDEERAHILAYRLVHANKWGNIKALGIMKRITKKEEL